MPEDAPADNVTTKDQSTAVDASNNVGNTISKAIRESKPANI